MVSLSCDLSIAILQKRYFFWQRERSFVWNIRFFCDWASLKSPPSQWGNILRQGYLGFNSGELVQDGSGQEWRRMSDQHVLGACDVAGRGLWSEPIQPDSLQMRPWLKPTVLKRLGRRQDSPLGEKKVAGFKQAALRQEDSGGNTRKPLTNHSITVIYLLEWATDS